VLLSRRRCNRRGETRRNKSIVTKKMHRQNSNGAQKDLEKKGEAVLRGAKQKQYRVKNKDKERTAEKIGRSKAPKSHAPNPQVQSRLHSQFGVWAWDLGLRIFVAP